MTSGKIVAEALIDVLFEHHDVIVAILALVFVVEADRVTDLMDQCRNRATERRNVDALFAANHPHISPAKTRAGRPKPCVVGLRVPRLE